MTMIARSLALLLTGTALAACSGGPQFTDLREKIWLAEPASKAVAEANTSSVPSDSYGRTLRSAYLDYAEFELNEMNDYGDAIFHASRSIQAANGQTVEPQRVVDRILRDAIIGEMTEAHARLQTALSAGGREIAPIAAARATASFDCWIEQAEENLQPDHITRCKTTFEQTVSRVEEAVTARFAVDKADRAVPELPDVITLDSDVLFAFDSARIDPATADDLVEVAELIKANPGIALTIQGHTDSIGSNAYNMSLSERRAQSVLTFLINQDANPDRFTVEAFGEGDPIASNDTEEGRAQNRRVEIHSK